MTALTLVMTTAGLSRFTDAQGPGDIDLTVAQVGFTASTFVAAPSLTGLPGEFRRVGAISGQAVGDNIVHMVVRDDAALAYTVRGFGLFLADGTLFAVYGQDTPIVEKSALATLLMPLDIAFPTMAIDKLTFGDANFLNPPATTLTKGIVELATQAEADLGTDPARVAPVSVIKAMLNAVETRVTAAIGVLDARLTKSVGDLATSIGQALDGLAAKTVYGSGLVKGGGRNDSNVTLTVDAANTAQVRAGTQSDVVVTPAGLNAAGFVYLVETYFDGQSRYRRYSDGVVEMSGVAGLPTNEAAFTLNFPRPFPTACEGLWATVINANQSNSGDTTVQEIALSAASARLYAQSDRDTSSDGAGGFRWFAKGY